MKKIIASGDVVYYIVAVLNTVKKSNHPPISIRIPEKIMTVLRQLAKQEERSLSRQILYILKNWLKDNGYLGNA